MSVILACYGLICTVLISLIYLFNKKLKKFQFIPISKIGSATPEASSEYVDLGFFLDTGLLAEVRRVPPL